MGGHGRTLTCANEEDVVVSVSSCHTVCSDLGEGVPGTHLQEERAPTHGQDRIVHEGVVPGKLNDVIRKVLGRTEGAKGLAGALGDGEEARQGCGYEGLVGPQETSRDWKCVGVLTDGALPWESAERRPSLARGRGKCGLPSRSPV